MSKNHFSKTISPSAVSNHPNIFVCSHCGLPVSQNAPGTKNRNHCPQCLWSRHLDEIPGDRKNPCKGNMRPIAISVNKQGEWSILHRCETCGVIRINRIAGDDNEFQLLAIAAKPLTKPPFPLESDAFH